MPRTNQIQYLSPSRPTPGATYHWKPSPRLRKLGWTNLCLGQHYGTAVARALDRNAEVEQWLQGRDAGSPGRKPPRVMRWRDLVTSYKTHPAYLDLKPKSRREYDSRINTLTVWALDGDLRLSDLDRQMVLDLRDALVRDGRKPRTAALLRVLSLLLSFAEDRGWIASHPGRKIKIPSPPKRRRRLLVSEIGVLTDHAHQLGHGHVSLAIALGFFTMQREGDLLATTAFQMREVDDISAEARRALAGPDGRVTGIWLQQGKTDEWVGIPLAPQARGPVDAEMARRRAQDAAGTHLIVAAGYQAGVPEWRFQRDFRASVHAAVEWATERQLHKLAKALDGIQYRDLRRSGMCWMRDLGVSVPMIAAISGHSIDETQKILDTYMPRDTRAAAEGMALAVTRQAARDAADAADGVSGQRRHGGAEQEEVK